MVAVRTMEVQQKKTTMSFKQLDGVLRTVDRDGNRQAMSHKCTELDRQIPMLLGVSKAILEHVVFCHQEDASWPLQEAVVVKKRFDDILFLHSYKNRLIYSASTYLFPIFKSFFIIYLLSNPHFL